MFSYCSTLDTLLTLPRGEILHLTPGEHPQKGPEYVVFLKASFY